MIKITINNHDHLEMELHDSNQDKIPEMIKFKLKTKSKLLIPLIMFALGVITGYIIWGV